jgi:hypothetical protein
LACFFITLIASARRRSIYIKLPQAGRASPAHLHFLCHYALVYRSELEGKTRSHDFEGRGSEWLHNQPISVQEKILGAKRREEWKAGRAGWMEKARNFELLGKKASRFKDLIFQLHAKKSSETKNMIDEEVSKGQISLTMNLEK